MPPGAKSSVAITISRSGARASTSVKSMNRDCTRIDVQHVVGEMPPIQMDARLAAAVLSHGPRSGGIVHQRLHGVADGSRRVFDPEARLPRLDLRPRTLAADDDRQPRDHRFGDAEPEVLRM